MKHAQKYGSVVAICHAREKALAFLHYLTQIQNNSIAFVTLDQLWKKQYVQCQKETNNERQDYSPYWSTVGRRGKERVDSLGSKIDIFARYRGGANAGHTFYVDGEKYVFRLLPSGMLYPGKDLRHRQWRGA